MGQPHAECLHEGRHVVGEQLGGIGAHGLVGVACPSWVHRDAREVLRVLGDLEGVTGLIGGEKGDQYEWFPFALHVVRHADAVGVDGRHGWLLVGRISPPPAYTQRTGIVAMTSRAGRPRETASEFGNHLTVWTG